MFGQGQGREPESQPSTTPSSFSFSGAQQAASPFGASSAFPPQSSSAPLQASASMFGGGTQASTGFGSSAGCQQPSNPGLFGSASRPVIQPMFPTSVPVAPQALNPLPSGYQSVSYPAVTKSTECDLVVTAFEVDGAEADLMMHVGGRRFRVCSRLVAGSSRKVMREIQNKETSSVDLHVSLPLATDPTPFIKWLNTQDMGAILSSITSLEAVVDMLALGVYFDLNPELHFEACILSVSIHTNINMFAQLPSCWDRAFIPLSLAVKAIARYRTASSSSSLFGSCNSNCVATQMALEWLGERRCFSAEEVESLRESAEFRGMKRMLQENYFLPGSINDYLMLAKRYPVGIDVFTIGDMFKGLGLI